jgi:hypothetical protein
MEFGLVAAAHDYALTERWRGKGPPRLYPAILENLPARAKRVPGGTAHESRRTDPLWIHSLFALARAWKKSVVEVFDLDQRLQRVKNWVESEARRQTPPNPDDEVAHPPAHQEAAVDPSELRRDGTEGDHQQKLQENQSYNDKLRRRQAQHLGRISIQADVVNVTSPSVSVARQESSRTARRGKQGTEMLERLRQGKLPKSLRGAAKAIEETYDTTRRAAHNSPFLRSHFRLKADGKATDVGAGRLLEELANQADKRTRELIEQMSPRERSEAEAQLQQMPREQWPELLRTLARDPDAGSTGDVSLIEEADQDSRTDDSAE